MEGAGNMDLQEMMGEPIPIRRQPMPILLMLSTERMCRRMLNMLRNIAIAQNRSLCVTCFTSVPEALTFLELPVILDTHVHYFDVVDHVDIYHTTHTGIELPTFRFQMIIIDDDLCRHHDCRHALFFELFVDARDVVVVLDGDQSISLELYRLRPEIPGVPPQPDVRLYPEFRSSRWRDDAPALVLDNEMRLILEMLEVDIAGFVAEHAPER